MDSVTIIVKIREQADDILKIAKAFGWIIEQDGLSIFVEMRHRRKSTPIYLLRISFEDYPQRAPSYIFVNKDKRESGSWPPNVKHGSEPPGICTPGTREFHEHYHKNDAQFQWNPENYSLRFVLMNIQKIIEK